MKFQAHQISKDFFVVTAATTTVERLRSVLAGRSALWVVLQDGEKYFVFPAHALLASILSSKGSQPLAASLSLDRITPSVPIANVAARIERESTPEPGTPSSRAIVIRR